MHSSRRTTITTALALLFLLGLSPAVVTASPLITLPEFQTLYLDYINHETQWDFPLPCVDANGTLTIPIDISHIMPTVTEAIAMAYCIQVQGYPPFTAGGAVNFSDPGLWLLNPIGYVPGHSDAFMMEFQANRTGDWIFDIIIENTGWPEGCVPNIKVLMAWDLLSVPVESVTWGWVKALY